ncbi:MAG: glycosyltransferase family 4 protein [Bacteroidales bacterium]
MKTIVVSAVNLNVGGTLTILRECLAYLSSLSATKNYRIIALVHKKELADYPNIEYIEITWAKKTWLNRLWCEYFTMYKISKRLAPVDLWLSLHDTTPYVQAKKQAVYCHNSFPFYKWVMRELLFTPKIILFALFTKWIYRINIYRNDYVIVQQNWFKEAFMHWFSLDKNQIIVSPPRMPSLNVPQQNRASQMRVNDKQYLFFYAALPNSHKNFEVLCHAAHILSERLNIGDFKVRITMKGDENGYARWLYKTWGDTPNLEFTGFLNKDQLNELYCSADALVFPSKIETWGLPVTEFSSQHKPMLLADLPYAHETASGCDLVCYFDPDNAEKLADLMQSLIRGELSEFKYIPAVSLSEPVAENWEDLFCYLLD